MTRYILNVTSDQVLELKYPKITTQNGVKHWKILRIIFPISGIR